MRKLKVLPALLALALSLPLVGTAPDTQAAVMTKQLPDGNYISMTSDTHYGGAITSLKFRNKEMVYTGEHGSSLMSAMTFDGYGECYNPTQGGSRIDAAYFGGVVESTITRSTYTSNNTIYTGSELGYWMPPNTPYPYACGQHPEQTMSVNTTVTSKVLLNANYGLGYAGYMNVMTNDVTFNIDAAHASAGFEPSTIYTPDNLSDGWYIDLTTGNLTPAVSAYEQNSPIIISTPDQQFAVGAMSKTNTLRYTYFSHPTLPLWAKIGTYYRTTTPVRANSAYKFQVQYILGTLEEVKATMLALKLLP